jgi:hypothetical protein
MAKSSIAFLHDELEIGILEQRGLSVIEMCGVKGRVLTIS